MTATTRSTECTAPCATLMLAFELGSTKWTLGFTTAPAQRPRLRTMTAGDLPILEREIQLAKVRFALPPEAPVRSCYEAGRDGFWLHRWLIARGVWQQGDRHDILGLVRGGRLRPSGQLHDQMLRIAMSASGPVICVLRCGSKHPKFRLQPCRRVWGLGERIEDIDLQCDPTHTELEIVLLRLRAGLAHFRL
jgi:hypothetical protein